MLMEYPQDHIVHKSEPIGERITHYGPDADQVIEFFGESNTGKQLLLIHGGYWRPTIDRAHLRPLAEALAQRNFRIALLEYRRVQGRPDDYLSDVFLGEEKGALERLDPIRLSAAKTNIHLMHSEHDFIPLEVAHRYYREKLAEGARIKFTLVPDADHFALVDPRSAGLGILLQALSEIE
ncbi:MAG: hypothetical protein EBY01_04130 [Actinobacteria bacterium]|nr:hypothetical protein [Actinomycetota bacterium]